MRLLPLILVSILAVGRVSAQVVSSEFNSDPVSEGWTLIQQFCDPVTSVADGMYHQQLDRSACPNESEGAQDAYTRTIEEFNGEPLWFYEFRVLTTGDRSEIPFGAPTVLVAFNSFGLDYTATVAKDQVKLFRDVDVPILFIDLAPDVPHTIRLELNNNDPATYRWLIDGEVVDEGLAKGPFPSFNSRIGFLGQSALLPTENWWDYIRFGTFEPDPVPTVSTWGVVIMALLLLTAGTMVLKRHRVTQDFPLVRS